MLNETPLLGRGSVTLEFHQDIKTTSLGDLEHDYFGVDLGIDCGLWGTPLPLEDLAFSFRGAVLLRRGLPVARRLFD